MLHSDSVEYSYDRIWHVLLRLAGDLLADRFPPIIDDIANFRWIDRFPRQSPGLSGRSNVQSEAVRSSRFERWKA